MLEWLSPNGAANVVDQNIQTTEALERRRHHPLALGELLKVGGQGQHLSDSDQFVGQLMY